ncbi:MAG: GNAT family N-acetyltransferase [Acidimicrobiales bacterium]|nr:GNAT family N-acetyltransferase [Acidimicrobiales bacterium]
MEAARPADAHDLPAMAALARDARSELEVQRGGPVWRARSARTDPVEDRLVEEIGRPGVEGCAVVGTIDGVVVGYGVSTLEPLTDGSILSVVSDLYVAPAARGVGVGEAMMDLLVGHAGDHGARGIDALALPGDRETKNFFETFGLKARAIVVHRDLRPDA